MCGGGGLFPSLPQGHTHSTPMHTHTLRHTDTYAPYMLTHLHTHLPPLHTHMAMRCHSHTRVHTHHYTLTHMHCTCSHTYTHTHVLTPTHSQGYTLSLTYMCAYTPLHINTQALYMLTHLHTHLPPLHTRVAVHHHRHTCTIAH